MGVGWGGVGWGGVGWGGVGWGGELLIVIQITDLDFYFWLRHSVGLDEFYCPVRHLPKHPDLLPLILLIAPA